MEEEENTNEEDEILEPRDLLEPEAIPDEKNIEPIGKPFKQFNAFTDFQPRPYQRKAIVAFERDGLDLALVWSRQLGKDVTSWLLMIRMAMRQAGTYLYMLPMTKQAKRAIWLKTVPNMGRIINWLPQKTTGNPNRADGKGFGVYSIDNNSMTIQLECIGSTPDDIQQSVIEVIGASERNADDFAGVSPSLCVFSEVGLNKSFQAIYRVLQPTMLANNTRQLLNSTPRGKNHWSTFYEEAKRDPRWHTSLVQTLYPEDTETYYPQMPVEDIYKSAKKIGMSDSWVEQEYGCSFEAKVEGSFYSAPLSHAQQDGRIGNFKYNRRLPVDVFYDLGIRDKCTMFFRQIDGDRVIFIDYHEDINLGTDEVVMILQERGYRYGKHQLPWDGNHRVHGRTVTNYFNLLKESLKAFRVGGEVAKPARRGSVVVGIEKVRGRFGKYHFDEENCQIALDHIANYSAKRRPDGSFSDAPMHDDHSHCCDALRVEAEFPNAGSPERRPKFGAKYISDEEGS